MLAFITNRGAIHLPHIRIERIKYAVRKSLVQSGQFSAALAIGVGMFILAFGIHLPASLLGGPNKADASRNDTIQTNLVANSPDSCVVSEKQTNSAFNACPSFYIDFGGQPNGAVDGTMFNHFAGAVPTNGEAQYYTGSLGNVRIQDGTLMLIALNQQNHGYQYTSGRVDTHGKEDFLYGKLVVRAEIPNNIGSWPAIWMLPSQPKYEHLSPADDPNRYLNDGEMDISESAGVQPHVMYGIAHTLAYPEDGKNHIYFNTTVIPNSDTSYHDYELDWTPTKLTFKVEGNTFFTYEKKPNADYTQWPFDQPFYLIANMALGGQMGGTDTAQFPGDGVDKSSLPAALKIQNIRYYSYAGRR